MLLDIKVWYKAIENQLKFPEQVLQKLKFQDRLMTNLTILFERCTNFKQSYCFIKVHWIITHFSSNNVEMQRKTEGLGQIYTRVMLCGQHIRLDYDKQKRTITCQLKPIISIRLQLQVNTVTLWVPFWSVSEDGKLFWKGLFQAYIQ